MLPRNLSIAPGADVGERGTRQPSWTLVGTVGSELSTPVDPAGLVVGDGWSLDWWVGADDRWHMPPVEAAVRQGLLQDSPVVETRVRIPGGDATHRAYGIRSPRPVGDEWVVVEITNSTPVPFAVALVIRPFVADGVGSVGEITLEPVAGGTGRDEAHLVRIDGRPALVLPRRPARTAAGNRATGDVHEVVTGGRAGADLVTATCPDGLATLAMVLPLTHTSTLRVLVPVGETGSAVDLPSVVPDAETVASGWDVHRRGPRIEVPDSRIAEGFERARAHIHLAHDGTAVRRDGHRARTIEPGATEVILGAFDLLGRPDDVGRVISGWVELLEDAAPDVDALFLAAVGRHWRLHREDRLLDWMLPNVAAAVERIDRAARRGRLGGPADARRAAAAVSAAARLLADAGQSDAGVAVTALADRLAADLPDPAPETFADELVLAAEEAAVGDPAGIARIRRAIEASSSTTAWPGPGAGGRPTGHDLAASAGLIHATFGLLVSDRPDGIALLPHLPPTWYGAGIEIHDAPTGHGRVSFAVRWHGRRPALLWEVTPNGSAPVELTIPGLDPTWSSSDIRGDALLAEVEPPEGVEQIELVVEHPDIDPEMRRPGDEPEPPAGPMPDGGSFS